DNMPHGFSVDKINKKLYVPCIDSILTIDIESKAIENKIYPGWKAWHIKVDDKKEYIYISTLDGKVVVLKKDTLNVRYIIDEFLIPVEICINYSKRLIYIADLGHKNIKIIDYEDYKINDCIYIEGNPQGLEISNDGKYLFVTDTFTNSIKIYDTDSNLLIKEIKVGKEPTTILFV
ncbi:MAG: YncE family protein, partial [Paraclostridium sp.]